MTFEAIEERGVEAFLENIRNELTTGTYRPTRNRKKAIPKSDGNVRILGIPTIRGQGHQRGESAAGSISFITLDAKLTGERSTRKPHAAFDVAGGGNVAWSKYCDTRSAANREYKLRPKPARQFLTLLMREDWTKQPR